ncbi:MAG TPA: hypothetical protein VGP48_01170 [Stellaceae bacterium]|nr:hypothetical protein [Stellaceae bacterium]
MKQTVSLAVATLLLFGCAGNHDWSRQGTSPQQAATELSDCESEAREATERDTNIMSDIMATRGNDWRNTDVLSMQQAQFAAENHNRTSDIVNRCMIGKGFVPGS